MTLKAIKKITYMTQKIIFKYLKHQVLKLFITLQKQHRNIYDTKNFPFSV